MATPQSFADAVMQRAEVDAGSPVIRLRSSSDYWTAGTLASRMQALAGALATVSRRGHVIATCTENGPEAVALTAGISALGAIELPLPASITPDWAASLADAADPDVVVVDSARARTHGHVIEAVIRRCSCTVVMLDAAVDPSPSWATTSIVTMAELTAGSRALSPAIARLSDTALIIPTSGTTGRPKAAVLPNGAGVGQATRVQRAMQYTSDDVLYNFFPWAHINARHAAVLPAISAGARIVVDTQFSASSFWARVVDAGATSFNFMGAVCAILLKQPVSEDVEHSISRAYGGPAPEWLFRAMLDRFGVTLLQAYACTELGDVSATAWGDVKPGAAGRVLPEYQARIVDAQGAEAAEGSTGLLEVRPARPHQTFSAYLGDPEATEAAWNGQWFRTGDRAHLVDGWLYFDGRGHEVIRRRGHNLSASLIEQSLMRLPQVADVAAAATPSELTEDELTLLIVPPSAESGDAQELLELCRASLPKEARPDAVVLVHGLPRTATGKLDRQRVSELAKAHRLPTPDPEQSSSVT